MQHLAVSAPLFLLFSTFCFSVFSQPQEIILKAHAISGDEFVYSRLTPNGVKVFSAKRPSSAMLRAIDNGFADLFAVARRYGYRNKLRFSDYTVFIANPDRTEAANGSYSPDIAINAAQYAGSVYDQGGFIYAAGIVVSNQSCAILIPQYTKDFSAAARIVRFEGEHIILYHNDRQKYYLTADHSRGGGHPILQ